jgi:hypothetical protein
MAIRYAVATGNWSNTATWNGGTLPTSADDVFSNNFTVTIDQDITVITLRNTSNASPVITQGGSFTVNNGVTITATGTIVSGFNFGLYLSSGNLLTISGTAGCNIVANFGTSQNTNSGATIACNTTGTVNIVGNITATSISVVSNGLSISGNGIVNLTGSVFGSGAGGSPNNVPIVISSAGTLNMVGNSNGGSVGTGISVTSAGIVNITGNVTAGTITGINCTGACVGILTGTSTASSVAVGINSSNTSGLWTILGNLINVNNYMAVNSVRVRISPTTSQSWTFQTSGSDRQLLTTNAFSDFPSVNDVRFGVTYSNLGSLTGLARIPDPTSVAFGVLTGPTATGTAMITRAQFLIDMGAIASAYNI